MPSYMSAIFLSAAPLLLLFIASSSRIPATGALPISLYPYLQQWNGGGRVDRKWIFPFYQPSAMSSSTFLPSLLQRYYNSGGTGTDAFGTTKHVIPEREVFNSVKRNIAIGRGDGFRPGK